MDQNWLSIVEYARKFDISDMTVRRRIKNGKLRAVLRDGKYYISSEVAKPADRPMSQTIETPIQSRSVSHVDHLQIRDSSDEVLSEIRKLSKSVNELGNIENTYKCMYENKICQLEAVIKSKDLRIQDIEQQIEDLQLLVKILEKKN